MRALIVAVLSALLCSLPSAAQTEGHGFVYKADGNKPVIVFSRVHHRVADVDDHQKVSVFASGRVRVHTPAYMVNPGTFDYQLSDEAMQSLLGKLEQTGLMDFDLASVRAQRDAAAETLQRSTGARFHVSDLTATHITINFANFGTRNTKDKPVQKNLVWNDLPADARRLKSVTALTGLAEAERILLRLADHSRRNAVRVSGGR